MCGIAGIVLNDGKPTEQDLICMRDVFWYRGPDDAGLWIRPAGRVGLAHRRLSILDPTPAGHQPMHDDQAGLSIVYNGEIYNFIELRMELQKHGHCFRTGTDTEVILAAYRQWDVECLQRFNGMFAIAIWDDTKRRLFLARDRLGVKPLYHYQSSDGFYFASELKAILQVLEKPPQLAAGLLDAYMSFGYVPGEDTLFRGIRRLLPGHFMLVDNQQHCQIHKYWELNYANGVDRGIEHYKEQVLEVLQDSIRLRLRSDVPLGIFLSGGIDSSAVVGLLAKEVPQRLKTFSVGYDFGPQYNETPYARMIAERFNTEHHKIFVTPDQFRDFIPKYVWLMDEPVTEAAAISLYFVSHMARDHVTVVLSGEGSDEVFAGYDFYIYMILLDKYRRMLGVKCTESISAIANTLFAQDGKICKYLSMGSLPLESSYKGISTHQETYKHQLYSQDLVSFIRNTSDTVPLQSFLTTLFQWTQNKDVLQRMLYFDMKTWLVDDLLTKADRMSMAASLELRVPFLDYRLVEISANIPSNYKIRRGVTKWILKNLLQDTLPSEIVHRKKMGFPTPLRIMFEKYLFEYSCDALLSPNASIRPYCNQKAIEQILLEHVSKRRDHHRVLWQLLVLETWMNIYIKNVHSSFNKDYIDHAGSCDQLSLS